MADTKEGTPITLTADARENQLSSNLVLYILLALGFSISCSLVSSCANLQKISENPLSPQSYIPSIASIFIGGALGLMTGAIIMSNVNRQGNLN